MLVAAVALAFVFDVTNGFHDSANAVAALVATNAASPRQAVALASVGNVLGPLLAGTAVAATVASSVRLPSDATAVLGAALSAAVVWNVVTWRRGLPSSSSHALVGGLAGAALAVNGWHGVRWGGLHGIKPTGMFGVVLSLAVSPLLGLVAGFVAARGARRAVRRASRAVLGPIRRAEWVTAAALAFSHGANDAQKTMGVVTLLLLDSGRLHSFVVPLWVKLGAAMALTIGTSLGGWRIVHTVGRGIYRLRPLDGLTSQGASAAVILASAAVGAPVSTTHVVASSVVGVGASGHWRHVRWRVVREMLLAWLVTVPAAGVCAVAVLPLWRWAT